MDARREAVPQQARAARRHGARGGEAPYRLRRRALDDRRHLGCALHHRHLPGGDRDRAGEHQHPQAERAYRAGRARDPAAHLPRHAARPPFLTLGELIERTAKRFAAARLFYGHGTDNPRDEAAWLVLRGLGLAFNADLAREPSPSELERIVRLVGRRIDERMPVAYLLKEAWLAGQSFYVDERVIVPRSHIAELLREPP